MMKCVRRYRRLLMLSAAGVTVYCILGPFWGALGCAMLVIVVIDLALDPRARRDARSLAGCCVH